jgi:hypothetical protein
MRASEDSYRLYNCARCAKQVRICRHCDRGNRYCAEGCAQQSRRDSRRRAAWRYQQSPRGACRHAVRQRAWRSRHAQKVTHHGSLASAVAFIVSFIATTRQEGSHADASLRRQLRAAGLRAHSGERFNELAVQLSRCCFCGKPLPAFARRGPLRTL